VEEIEKPSAEIQILTFLIGEEEYGVALTEVREIIEYTAATKVPNSPYFIRGVINLRGSVVPVVDLAAKFGFDGLPVTKRTCIIIAEIEHEGKKILIGMIVDRVNQVLEILPADIEAAPSFGAPVRNDYIRGLAKREKSFILILALEKVLSYGELRPDLPIAPGAK
jgi:purine-binding chemotaxis protein CheW